MVRSCWWIVPFAALGLPLASLAADARIRDVLPPVGEHVHGASVVEVADGELLAAWFQGSGERWADDVAIRGARLSPGKPSWSESFVLADVPGFPDINPALFIGPRRRLWLVWYTVLANQWETSLPKYRVSDEYAGREGPPLWAWQGVIHFRPGDPAERGIRPDDRFVRTIERKVAEQARHELAAGRVGAAAAWRVWGERLLARARGEDLVRDGLLRGPDGREEKVRLGYPLARRIGWQTKNKALVVGDRILLPLYSDGFSFSLVAITEDGGRSWSASEPLVGGGNIQPSILERSDGTLLAYMRDNGPPPARLLVSTSDDGGRTWSRVRDSLLPNPGSGADAVRLRDGRWAIAYNDTERGRASLAVSVSADEGRSWRWTRHLERDEREDDTATRFAYPAIIQTRDGRVHVIYSVHRREGDPDRRETIRHACFPPAWVEEGDEG